uniref:Uncharacterized protein n=1 Tax=Arion vulgaris TaxID=1028688 RepID=A0A0B7A3L5_9EUPU
MANINSHSHGSNFTAMGCHHKCQRTSLIVSCKLWKKTDIPTQTSNLDTNKMYKTFARIPTSSSVT